SSSDISSFSIIGLISSRFRPVKFSAFIVAKSEPLPLTHITSTSLPLKSFSIVLVEVLPPPQFATERSCPIKLERYTSSPKPVSTSLSLLFQRFLTNRLTSCMKKLLCFLKFISCCLMQKFYVRVAFSLYRFLFRKNRTYPDIHGIRLHRFLHFSD